MPFWMDIEKGYLEGYMNTKSALTRLLAMIFAFALLATACGSSDDGDSSDSAADTTEAADTSSDDASAEEAAEEPAEEEAMEEAAEEPAEEAMEEEETVELTQGGGTVDAILSRGELNCGVSGAAIAFSVTQPDGSQVGFDADYCRAVAAAILGDAEAVNFVALTAAERFTAVQTGDVDVLMRNTTWTQSRDTDVGMEPLQLAFRSTCKPSKTSTS